MLRSSVAVRENGNHHLAQLLDALSAEAMKLLDYLEEEYFEDITDDPRFERLNGLLSLHMILKRDPNDPNLARFFAELERGNANTSGNGTGKH